MEYKIVATMEESRALNVGKHSQTSGIGIHEVVGVGGKQARQGKQVRTAVVGSDGGHGGHREHGMHETGLMIPTKGGG